jgi:hypothetical protein
MTTLLLTQISHALRLLRQARLPVLAGRAPEAVAECASPFSKPSALSEQQRVGKEKQDAQ